MSPRVSPVLALLFLAALGACKSSVPARVKEKPIALPATCNDADLLNINTDTCEWMRIDGATGETETLLTDAKYCASYSISVHPTRPRLFAYLVPYDDRQPEAVREISIDEGVYRTIQLPPDLFIDYSGYDAQGRITVVVGDELPEPSRVMQLVDDLLERESCGLYRARALAFDGSKWAQSAVEVAPECGDAAPSDELNQRMLSPWTMIGTSTLTGLARVEDRAVLDALNVAMDDADHPPEWREAKTPHGRILRGADTYGAAFWIAFTDPSGRVVGKPEYEDNPKLRVRGPYLLATSDDEENGRLYDVRSGRLVWESGDYSATVFWPCAGKP